MADAVGDDRISDLPQSIVYHILSFLPTKDVYKTSALSKTFLSWWSSYPVIVLDYRHLKEPHWDRKKAFIDSLHRIIQRRNIETDLQTFKLKVPVDKTETDHRIFEAIDFAIRKRVKELDIDLYLDWWDSFPTLVITTGSFNSITRLNLRGLQLKYFKDLIGGCPLIERLQIRDCSGLKDFIFSSTTIRSVEFKYCKGLQNLTIESPSLEKLKVWQTVNYSMDISNCVFLKVLLLAYDDDIITDGWVEHTIPLLAHLEDLKFIQCRGLKNLKISNENLKRVTLLECMASLTRLQIVGENLESLNFNGSRNCKIKFVTPRLVSFISNYAETHSSWYWREHDQTKVTLSIQEKDPLFGSSFVTLRDFIGYFPSCKHLNLICSSNEKLVIADKLRGKTINPFYGLMSLKIIGFSSISTDLVERLLLLLPSLHTLCFALDGVERSLKFRRNKEIIRDESPMCCSDLLLKCWRHYFKIVKLKNFDTPDGINLRKYFEQNGKMVSKWN